jgi:hypothetical protein
MCRYPKFPSHFHLLTAPTQPEFNPFDALGMEVRDMTPPPPVIRATIMFPVVDRYLVVTTKPSVA